MSIRGSDRVFVYGMHGAIGCLTAFMAYALVKKVKDNYARTNDWQPVPVIAGLAAGAGLSTWVALNPRSYRYAVAGMLGPAGVKANLIAVEALVNRTAGLNSRTCIACGFVGALIGSVGSIFLD